MTENRAINLLNAAQKGFKEFSSKISGKLGTTAKTMLILQASQIAKPEEQARVFEEMGKEYPKDLSRITRIQSDSTRMENNLKEQNQPFQETENKILNILTQLSSENVESYHEHGNQFGVIKGGKITPLIQKRIQLEADITAFETEKGRIFSETAQAIVSGKSKNEVKNLLKNLSSTQKSLDEKVKKQVTDEKKAWKEFNNLHYKAFNALQSAHKYKELAPIAEREKEREAGKPQLSGGG